MKTMKKMLSLLMVTGLLLAATTGAALAADDSADSQKAMSYYLSITGTVVSLEGNVKIEDENGNPATLVISDKTVYPFESELSVGDVVTGFYLANAPMIMIWPPQYNIAVLIAGIPEGDSVKADRFYAWKDNSEGYMLSQEGSFAFKIGKETEVVLADGKDFTGGEIEGRRMVVIYDMSTRSIPELTTARKVIVLFEDAVPLPEIVPEPIIDAAGWPVVVDGVEIDAPAAFQTDDGIVMVPLRAIAEALGFKVEWDAKARAVTLDEKVKLVIGEEGSVIVNSFTYVPLSYFKDVLEMVNAFAFEGQIEIHSEGEIME